MPDHGEARLQQRGGGAGNNAPAAQLLLQNGQEVNSSLIDAILDTDSFLVSVHSFLLKTCSVFLIFGTLVEQSNIRECELSLILLLSISWISQP